MRFNSFAFAAGMVAAALCPAFAQGEELPTRKVGLWESSMKSGDGKFPAMTVKQCIDTETDKAALTGVANGMCDLKWKRAGDDRIETETNCKIGPISAAGKGVITGDFNSSIKIETTTTTSASGEGMPAGAPTMNMPPQTQTMLIEARWIGPCEAGQRPGDIVMPDGSVMPTQKPGLPGK